METGGYKNRSRTMPKAELHALITERLGVPRENIICEYGMSELSSQAYDSVTSDEWRVSGKAVVPPVTRHPSLPFPSLGAGANYFAGDGAKSPTAKRA